MKKALKFIRTIVLGMIMLTVAVMFAPEPAFAAVSAPARPAVSASVSSTTVTLSWKKVIGAKGYQVYRATSKNGRYKRMKTTVSCSYKNTRLKNGRMYFYKVRSYKKNHRKKDTQGSQ